MQLIYVYLSSYFLLFVSFFDMDIQILRLHIAPSHVLVGTVTFVNG